MVLVQVCVQFFNFVACFSVSLHQTVSAPSEAWCFL